MVKPLPSAKGLLMTNDAYSSDLTVAVSDQTALVQMNPSQFNGLITQHVEAGRHYLNQVYVLMYAAEPDLKGAEMALYQINDSLTALESLGVGLSATAKELAQQRDNVMRDYQLLEQDVDGEIVDAVAQCFVTDDDIWDAEVRVLAHQMVKGDEQEVIREAKATLARKLQEAQELAGEVRAGNVSLDDDEADEDTEEVVEDDDESA